MDPHIKYTKNCHDMSDRRQDFTVRGNLTKLVAKIKEDSAETGCMYYTVLTGEDEGYPVWRKET